MLTVESRGVLDPRDEFVVRELKYERNTIRIHRKNITPGFPTLCELRQADLTSLQVSRAQLRLSSRAERQPCAFKSIVEMTGAIDLGTSKNLSSEKSDFYFGWTK